MRDTNFLVGNNARHVWHPMAHPAEMLAKPPKIINAAEGVEVLLRERGVAEQQRLAETRAALVEGGVEHRVALRGVDVAAGLLLEQLGRGAGDLQADEVRRNWLRLSLSWTKP